MEPTPQSPPAQTGVPQPALFLCRSPLQALIAGKIAERENLTTFDVIYNKGELGPKDHRYFAALAARARHALIFSKREPLGYFKLVPFFLRRYRAVLIAHVTFSLFRLLISRNCPPGRIFTFDDGFLNFDPAGAARREARTAWERRRDRVLGAIAPVEVFARSSAHYTIDPSIGNIVPDEKLRPIGFTDDGTGELTGAVVNLIVGQPFEEYLQPAEVALLREAMACVPDARYFPHPREKAASLPPSMRLCDDERLLEDFVYAHRREGTLVRVIGGFSSVLATVRGRGVERYFLSAAEHGRHLPIAERLGCMSFDLHDPADRERWRSLTRSWGGWN